MNTANTTRIGLLGGSFDPPHYGHLQLAEAALRALQLHEIRFIIAAQPWQKTGVSAVSHRLAMLALAIKETPHYAIETCELARTGPTYTIDTLQILRQRYGHDACLVLLIGADQYANLPTWHAANELLSWANIAVAQRPGHSMPLPAHAIPIASAGQCVSFDMPSVDISSTKLRQALSSGKVKGLERLLPSQVLAYSLNHHLYSESA